LRYRVTASPLDKATSVDQKTGHWQLFLVLRLKLSQVRAAS